MTLLCGKNCPCVYSYPPPIKNRLCTYSRHINVILKAKKTHGFNSCIVISVYSLDILSIKKATEYRNN